MKTKTMRFIALSVLVVGSLSNVACKTTFAGSAAKTVPTSPIVQKGLPASPMLLTTTPVPGQAPVYLKKLPEAATTTFTPQPPNRTPDEKVSTRTLADGRTIKLPDIMKDREKGYVRVKCAGKTYTYNVNQAEYDSGGTFWGGALLAINPQNVDNEVPDEAFILAQMALNAKNAKRDFVPRPRYKQIAPGVWMDMVSMHEVMATWVPKG